MHNARTSKDDCLLCLHNKAKATNSHIYSKFFTKTLFGDPQNKEGYELSTERKDPSKPSFDTPKEDFILCPDCERIRFGKLETYIATHFYYRYRNIKFQDAFPIVRKFNYYTKELDSIVCDRLHTGMFKLYIYSLVWRASISNHPTFKDFKLPDDIENTLRETLDEYLKGNDKDTIDYYDQNKDRFPQFQFNIITAEDPNEVANLVTAPLSDGKNSLLLYVNEFMIIFYLKDQYSKYDRSSNPGQYPINISLTRKGEWNKYTRIMAEMFAENHFKKHGPQKG